MKKPQETINSELLGKIEAMMEDGELLKNIIYDIVEFDGYDFQDVVDILPDELLYKLKVELAQEGYKEAMKCVPEMNSYSVTGMMTHE